MTSKTYRHGEAFCLMRYASKDNTVVEFIWNSRDGVTPFIICAKDEKTELQHVDWQKDERRENHKPMPGDRIFVDLSPDRAREIAYKVFARWSTNPEFRDDFLAIYPTKEDFATKCPDFQPGPQPDLVYFHA
jgi:hypothetical protein